MPDYPRPQIQRTEWTSLDGLWDFALDADCVFRTPDEPPWDARIRVPFAPETPASGIANTGFYRTYWYRREFEQKRPAGGGRGRRRGGAGGGAAAGGSGGRRAGAH